MNCDVAIIGLSGRFPKAANVNVFYRILRDGMDCIEPVSIGRILDTNIPQGENYQVCGMLDDIDKFDYAFFNISRAEAELMDPHQRFLLEVAYEAFENAGMPKEVYRGSNTGVYISSGELAYQNLISEFNALTVTGNQANISAGKISRFFNLTGPAMVIDTACSSSLVAMHTACNALILGEIDQALVACAKVNLFPPLRQNPIDLGILSPEGRTRAFSAGANGTNMGEACVAILLKPLSRALADGDIIHAVIKATAVNQDADRSSFLTAPSKDAQAEVLLKAWHKAGIDPLTISYIEAHGTGTKIGDPIEVSSITTAFSRFTTAKMFCGISSVKTNIGHTDNAAGLCGLVKVVLSLKNKELFPSLHFHAPNPLIDFPNTAVYVNNELKAWAATEGQPRRAGVNSFGFSGTNCHAVLEEYVAPPRMLAAKRQLLFPFSSKTQEDLLQNLKAFVAFLSSAPQVDMADVSYTLSIGRDHYTWRTSFVADNATDLMSQIQAFISQEANNKAKRIRLNDAYKLVLLFSSDVEISPDVVSDLCTRYHLFKESFLLAGGRAEAVEQNRYVNSFAYQYAYYKLLEQEGIVSRNLLGIGIGKTVVDVIRGKASAEYGAAVARTFHSAPEHDLSNRMLKFVNSEGPDGGLILMEAGVSGSLGKVLTDLNSDMVDLITAPTDAIDPLVWQMKELFACGYPVSFRKYWRDGAARRIELPAYQFSKIRCWAKERDVETILNVDELLYEKNWVNAELPMAPDTAEVASPGLLVLMDKNGRAEKFVAGFGEGACIRIYQSSMFRHVGSDAFEIDPVNEEHFGSLLNWVDTQGIAIRGVVCFFDEYGLADQSAPLFTRDLCRLYHLYKVFHQLLAKKGFTLLAVTHNAFSIAGSSEPGNPFVAAAMDFFNSILSDNPQILVRAIDSDDSAQAQSEIHRYANSAVSEDDNILFVAYRSARRYVQELRRVEIKSNERFVLPDRGTFIVTGGASGIGLEVSKYIASASRACTLIILGRTSLEDTDGLPDPRRIAMNHLESLGATIYYHRVDVASEEQMSATFQHVKSVFSKVDGVIHAAGVGGKFAPIQSKSWNEVGQTLAPKVTGTLLLDAFTRDLRPDFFVMFSSLNAIVPQKHSLEYTVANAFQYHYATYQRTAHQRNFIAVCWPGWRDTGMSARMAKGDVGPSALNFQLKTESGLQIFARALQCKTPNLIVAIGDISKFKSNPYFRLPGMDRKPIAPDNTNIGPKPQVAATVEQRIVHIFEKVLKPYDQLQPDDDFFDLGGNSLNGTQVINHLEKEFGTVVTFEDLLEYGTSARLAVYIKGRTAKTAKERKNITAIEEQEYYNTSNAQRRLWIIQQLEEDQSAYHLPAAFVLKQVNVDVLEKAFYHIMERHEILRSCFIAVQGEPKQKVVDAGHLQFSIPRVDLTRSADPTKAASEFAAQDARTPFDFDSCPLFRAHFLCLPGNEIAFLLTLHHVISDGWSMQVLFSEIRSCYEALMSHQPLPDPLRIQYKDYTAWQNQQLSGTEEFQESRRYWHNVMKSEIPVVDMPVDFKRPQVKTYNGQTLSCRFEAQALNEMKKLCAAQGTTMFMFLVTVVKTLIYRHTGLEDITVGSPIAGRDHIYLENQIGFYINTLALRTQFNGSDSFISVLDRVKQTTLGAYAHQTYPFDRLVDDLNLVRDRSRMPIFDIMVGQLTGEVKTLANGLRGEKETVTAEFLATDISVSQFDLEFTFKEYGDVLDVFITYNTDLFRRSTAERLLAQYKQLALASATSPGIPMAELDMLQPSEMASLCYHFNNSLVDHPTDKTFMTLFEQQVEDTPDAIALIVADRQFSYSELNERANFLANRIRNQWALREETIVAVICARSEALLISVLGIFKARCSYLPIDPITPVQRMQYLLADAMPGLVISEADLLPELDVSCDTLSVEQLMQGSPLKTNLRLPGLQNDNAYVIYTSGSTGKPKGVMIEHGSMLNHLQSKVRTLEISERTSILQNASQGFDISIWQLLAVLMKGGSVTICTDEIILDARAFLNSIERHKINVLEVVPSYLHVLVDSFKENAALCRRFHTLTFLLSTGEEFKSSLASTVHEMFPGLRIINAYGPTEAGDDIAQYEINPGDKHAIIPVGTPLDNMKIYILNEAGTLCPIGAKGEIVVTGPGVGRGYLNAPEKTAESFLPGLPGIATGHAYKTGDIGSWSENGVLMFYGRKDKQLKINGHRIEPGEVENTLLEHEAVKTAVVETFGPADTKKLVAYLVLQHPATSDEIRAYLAHELPAYMIPSAFVVIDRLPLTDNGKVDRRSLPPPAWETDKKKVPAQTPMEQALLSVWESVLHKDQIGVTDNFFEHGGDSIKAIQIASRMNQKGFKLTIKDIFQHQTISTLAPQIKPLSRHADQGAVSGEVALVPAQHEFFQHNPLYLHHYNLSLLFKCAKGISEPLITFVFEKIMAHHDALRTTFQQDDAGNVKAIVHDIGFQPNLEVFELTQDSWKEQLAAEAQRIQGSIDLEHGPLVKLGLFKTPEGDRLLTVVHHLITDGVSWRILLEDMNSLFASYFNGQAAVLPPKTDSVKVWAEKLLYYANSGRILSEAPYWKRITDLDIPTITTDFNGEYDRFRDDARAGFSLSDEDTRSLLGKANQAFSTQVNDILLTGLGLAYYRTTGSFQACIMLESHGREEFLEDIDVSRTMGWFSSEYPVALDMRFHSDLSKQIKEIKETVRRIPGNGLGYGLLKFLRNGAKLVDDRHRPQIRFNYLGQFKQGEGGDGGEEKNGVVIAGEPIGSSVHSDLGREYEIDIRGVVAGERLSFEVGYSCRRFRHQTIEKFAAHFRNALLEVINHCVGQKHQELTPSDLSMKDISADDLDAIEAMLDKIQ